MGTLRNMSWQVRLQILIKLKFFVEKLVLAVSNVVVFVLWVDAAQ